MSNRINPEYEALQRSIKDPKPKGNYEDAIDMDISFLRSWLTDKIQPLGLPTGLSNCTLTASQWINPELPIGRAATIVTNPDKYGFAEIPEEYAIPGTLVIASKDPSKYKDGGQGDNANTYHTMLLSGFADKDYDYEYGGKKYKILKGEPLVTYSRGKNDLEENYRRDIPLRVYNDQGEGKIFNRFYKPKSELITGLLPGVTIYGTKKK